MNQTYEFWPFNFGSQVGQSFNKAKLIILPVAYEATLSFRTGTSAGPHAIIDSSRFLEEMWDTAKPGQLDGFKAKDIFTLDEMRLTKESQEKALESLTEYISRKILKNNKFPLVLGGEHSLSYAAVKALKAKYRNLSVLHFDAHNDLIDNYEGNKFSHACVMRRIYELKVPFVSVGIRNKNFAVEEFIKSSRLSNVYHAPGLPPVEKVFKNLSRNVYLTFDLDAFDPSIMPSVGTPEPGGLYWQEVINFLEKISQKANLVGADVVELCPVAGLEAPNFLAAKLVYHIVSFKLAKKSR